VKGLLHRLAARATGASVTVRSDARLAVLGATLPGAADPVVASFELAPRPQNPGPSTAPALDPPHDRQVAAIAPPISQHWEPRRPEPAPSSDAGAIRQPAEVMTKAPSPHVPVTLPPHPIAVSIDGRGPGRARTQSAIDPPQHADRWPREDERRDAADPPQHAADRRPREDEGRDAAVRIVCEPPRLVSPVADGARLAPPAGVSARPRTADANTLGQTDHGDVHIHIGCVEVTAVHEPASPRRRPKPPPAPMSLDTYLAKRERS
jgi:hypothetical protein